MSGRNAVDLERALVSTRSRVEWFAQRIETSRRFPIAAYRRWPMLASYGHCQTAASLAHCVVATRCESLIGCARSGTSGLASELVKGSAEAVSRSPTIFNLVGSASPIKVAQSFRADFTGSDLESAELVALKRSV